MSIYAFQSGVFLLQVWKGIYKTRTIPINELNITVKLISLIYKDPVLLSGDLAPSRKYSLFFILFSNNVAFVLWRKCTIKKEYHKKYLNNYL